MSNSIIDHKSDVNYFDMKETERQTLTRRLDEVYAKSRIRLVRLAKQISEDYNKTLTE